MVKLFLKIMVIQNCADTTTYLKKIVVVNQILLQVVKEPP